MLAILKPGRLFAVILTLALLAGCLLVTQPQSAKAADAPSTAATSKINVRAALAGAGSADIALVDQVTPRPSIEGKSILCVDGDFYGYAGNAVVDNVKEKARGGIPIVFVGGDINELCLSLGGPQDVALDPEGRPVKEFGALKLTKGADGQTVFNYFRSSDGNSNPGCTMAAVREWLEEVDKPKRVRANDQYTQFAYMRYYTYDDLKPYGKQLVDRYYYQLKNDGVSALDFFTVDIFYEVVSGQAAYTKNWKNRWASLEANVVQYQPSNTLLRYSPLGGASGQVSESYTLGVSYGESGLNFSAQYGVTYTQPDVVLQNSGDTGSGLFRLKWTINKNAPAADGTFASSGIGFTYANPASTGSYAKHWEKWETQWCQYHWYGNKYYNCSLSRAMSINRYA
jgi:hypothetical protein